MGLWGEAVAVDRHSSAVEAIDRREGMVEEIKGLMILQVVLREGMFFLYTFFRRQQVLQIYSSVTCTQMPFLPALLSSPEHGGTGATRWGSCGAHFDVHQLHDLPSCAQMFDMSYAHQGRV